MCMHITDMETPAFLVELDTLEANIADMAAQCRCNGIELWPMVKTHKSSEIANMQAALGAQGFLTGTLDEAECLIERGFTRIMLAYPAASRENIQRVVAMSRRVRVLIGLDGVEAARLLDQELGQQGRQMEYLIIIDCGLRRFGVLPGEAAGLAQKLSGLQNLVLAGIATHPGHVYGVTTAPEVALVASEEITALQQAKAELTAGGFHTAITATGSTPTAAFAAESGAITALRPGNYVFYDAIQAALGVVPLSRCALTVLATVLSQPRPDTFIIDAGSKCLGLDKGAHGNTLVNGHGIVIGHPEALIAGLSEEVGKITVSAASSLKVGDKIQIIPNHACSAVNMTSQLIGHRAGLIDRVIAVDMRNGTRPARIDRKTES
jgi:D-serine deaminase-like pyridoxal phosphate-dependent protein